MPKSTRHDIGRFDDERQGSVVYGLHIDAAGAIDIGPDGKVTIAGGADDGVSGNFVTARFTVADIPRRIFVQQDANHNVTSLTDLYGTMLERFVEDPYGDRVVLTPSFTSTTDVYNMVYGFQGGRLTPADGLYHFNARDYDVNLGRWISQDLQLYVNGANLYQIETGSPTKWNDPSGLEIEPGDDLLKGIMQPVYDRLAELELQPYLDQLDDGNPEARVAAQEMIAQLMDKNRRVVRDTLCKTLDSYRQIDKHPESRGRIEILRLNGSRSQMDCRDNIEKLQLEQQRLDTLISGGNLDPNGLAQAMFQQAEVQAEINKQRFKLDDMLAGDHW